MARTLFHALHTRLAHWGHGRGLRAQGTRPGQPVDPDIPAPPPVPADQPPHGSSPSQGPR